MKILLIAGHGAGDPGASGKLDNVTYREADETRNLVGLLSAWLTRRGVEVTVYDTNRNAYQDLKNKKLTLPTVNYVLEVHFNAITQSAGDGKTKGAECYVTTKESGTGVEEAICRNLAGTGLTNRGVKRKNFAVISAAKQAGMSSALLETCFIDDPDDLRLYISKRETFARAIADGICEGFGIHWSEPSPKKNEAETAKEWAIAEGIFKGDGKGNYNWTNAPTREELAIVLYRALGKE